MPRPDAPPLTRGVVLRAAGFTVAVALGAVAIWLIVTGGMSAKRIQLGVLAGLWGLLLGTYSMFGSRRFGQPSEAAAPRTELAVRSSAEVERVAEAAARRAFEGQLEQLLRREIGDAMRREVADLRREIASLRQELVEKVGGELRLERIETTRLIGSDLEALQHEVRQLKVATAGPAAVPGVPARQVGDLGRLPSRRSAADASRVRTVGAALGGAPAAVAASAVPAPDEPSYPAAAEADRLEAARVEGARLEAAKVEAQAARLEAAKAEAAKAEAARVEAAKVEAAKVDAAKVEAAKVEAAKVEAAKVEAAKVEAAKVEAAKVEAAKVEAAKAEAARIRAARAEAQRLEAIRADDARRARAEAERARAAEAERRRVEQAKQAQVEAERAAGEQRQAEQAQREREAQQSAHFAAAGRSDPSAAHSAADETGPLRSPAIRFAAHVPSTPARAVPADARGRHGEPTEPAAAASDTGSSSLFGSADPFASLPRITPFTDFELDPIDDPQPRAAVPPAEPTERRTYTGRRRRSGEPTEAADAGRHASGDSHVDTPAETGSRRRRHADDNDDGMDLLSRLLARENAEH